MMRLINFMTENMICMKQLSLLDVKHALRPYIDTEINYIRHFIKILFINKGIKFIDLSSIFRDDNVMSAIPLFFENTESPIICYKYNRPIRNTVILYFISVGWFLVVILELVPLIFEIIKIQSFVINHRVILSLVTLRL